MKTTSYVCNLCKLPVNRVIPALPKSKEEETATEPKHGVKSTFENDRLILEFVPNEESDIHICARCCEKLGYVSK